MSRPGPTSFYRPKNPKPVTVNLTTEGLHLLNATALRTKASRADVVEQLLRRFSENVDFTEATPCVN